MSLLNYFLQFYTEQNGERISSELADVLVSSIGEKWSIAESKKIGDELFINWDAVSLPEWYLILNTFYSKYEKLMQDRGINDPLIYGEFSRVWFTGNNPSKTFRYFFNS